MIFVYRFIVIMRDTDKVIGLSVGKAFFHLAMERALIAFQAEDILPVLFSDLLGDSGLAAHRINAHNAHELRNEIVEELNLS